MDNSQKNIFIPVIATVLALLVPGSIYYFVKLPVKLTPDEKAIYSFNNTPLQFAPRTWENGSYTAPVSPEAISSALNKAAAGQNINPIVLAHPPQQLPSLTFILQNNGKNMAILDGSVVREGSSINGWRVKRIESTRVLIQGKRGTQWLNMD